jgi:fructose-specific phosphotransferase system IIA component
MKITEVLSINTIAPLIKLNTKEEIIKFMVELAAKSGKILNQEQALNDVLEREKVLSTGIGKGIALPHAKTNSVSDFCISLATLVQPVDYDSLDIEPVNIVILLLGPENQIAKHLKLLSKISKIVNIEENRLKILSFASSEEILNFIAQVEEEEEDS